MEEKAWGNRGEGLRGKENEKTQDQQEKEEREREKVRVIGKEKWVREKGGEQQNRRKKKEESSASISQAMLLVPFQSFIIFIHSFLNSVIIMILSCFLNLKARYILLKKE